MKSFMCHKVCAKLALNAFCMGTAIVFGSYTTVAQAQFNNQQVPSLTSVEIKGDLLGAQGNILQVSREDGSVMFVQLPQEQRQIQYRANLKATQLQPGMLARFRVDYETLQAGKVDASSIEVFSASEINFSKPRTPAERAEYTVGMYPLAKLGHDPNSKEVLVVGSLVGIKDNKLVINAGQSIQIELKEDMSFVFRSASLNFAKPGDAVEGNGITYNPQSNQVAGNRIMITGTIPENQQLDTKSAGKKKRGSKSRKSAKPDDEASVSEAITPPDDETKSKVESEADEPVDQ